MRILKLKFKNINSLAGENEIDFTSPVFTNDGLFAITGKTGAGKSSILDAISIALYGKTPRVDITGSENPVMTRGEKDSYSEVVFEVNGRVWKSSWSQERTRNNTLKQVRRSIADAEDRIIADQVRTCDTEIVSIMGLTFEQFTKVILLAQGSFAAFLKAKQNEKGELLEQITGTEIYGIISQKVYEKFKEEAQKLKDISIALEQIRLLTDAEIGEKQEKIALLSEEKNRMDRELQTIGEAIKWLGDMAAIRKVIGEKKEGLPELEEAFAGAQMNLEAALKGLNDVKSEMEAITPVLNQVRELDVQIGEKKKLLAPVLKTIETLGNELRDLTKTVENQKGELKKSEELLEEKKGWSAENQHFESLVFNFNAIENEHKLLEKVGEELRSRRVEIKKSEETTATKKSEFDKAAEELTKAESELAARQRELDDKRNKKTEILGNKELSDYQAELTNLNNYGVAINALMEVKSAIKKGEEEIAELSKKIVEAGEEEKRLSEGIAANKAKSEGFDEQIRLLEENIELSRVVQSLEQHRHELEDGKPCPLCGALEHPYAEGNVPQIGDREEELRQLKLRQKELEAGILKDNASRARTVALGESSLKNKQDKELLLAENQIRKGEILSEIHKYTLDKREPDIEELKMTGAEIRNEYNRIGELIKNASALVKEIDHLRDVVIPGLQKKKEAAERNKAEKNQSLQLAIQQLEDKKESLAADTEKFEQNRGLLENRMMDYGVKTMEGLQNALNLWNTNKQDRENLEKAIEKLNTGIALSEKDILNKQDQLKKKEEEKTGIEKEKEKLETSRKELFGEKSVQEEEDRMKALLAKAEKDREVAEEAKSAAGTALLNSKAVIREKEKELNAKEEQRLTGKTAEELQSENDGMKTESMRLSEEIGAINQELRVNESNLAANREKLAEKERQQKVLNNWSSLNLLIGSGDGKKYRNFAQSLTFEHLIALANRQLEKMSDRYILKRSEDTSNPFELSVIDKYQDGEERTANNLSGGETFIMSLSMALGLANMAGRNMRIDTMFIDEGFGTLDSGYLDVALSALSNLQSEGKIIGIISHLAELKERIATHIEVVQVGNGKSAIRIVN